MKMKTFLYAFCTVLGFTTCIFAQEKIEERVYLESGTIQIAKGGIYLDLGEEFLSVSAVGQDQHGTYVTVPPDGVNVVICRKCGKSYDEDNQSKKCPHGWIVHN